MFLSVRLCRAIFVDHFDRKNASVNNGATMKMGTGMFSTMIIHYGNVKHEEKSYV